MKRKYICEVKGERGDGGKWWEVKGNVEVGRRKEVRCRAFYSGNFQ